MKIYKTNSNMNSLSYGYILKLSGFMFATEDILRTRPIIFLSISSSDFPCVSGTYKMVKNKPTTQIAPKNQKAPCVPMAAKN